MTPAGHIEDMLDDCLLAAGQGIGSTKPVDFDALGWWRARYRAFFTHAVVSHGNSWSADRDRVTAVGRYLGQRALHHAGPGPTIDLRAAVLAAKDVETGCRMNAARESGLADPLYESSPIGVLTPNP